MICTIIESYNIMDFQSKVNQLLKRAKLRTTTVHFQDFYKKNNKTYIYRVVVRRADYLNSSDRVNSSYLNRKIHMFNSLTKELSYVNLKLSTANFISSYQDRVELKLYALFTNNTETKETTEKARAT